MTSTTGDAHSRSVEQPVIDWLLNADPSIRWQVMHDLTGAPADLVAAERSRVASEGWGPRLLDQQRPDGQWGDGVAAPWHRDTLHEEIARAVGEAKRWITLRALRVLDWQADRKSA